MFLTSSFFYFCNVVRLTSLVIIAFFFVLPPPFTVLRNSLRDDVFFSARCFSLHEWFSLHEKQFNTMRRRHCTGIFFSSLSCLFYWLDKLRNTVWHYIVTKGGKKSYYLVHWSASSWVWRYSASLLWSIRASCFISLIVRGFLWSSASGFIVPWWCV